MSVSRLEDDLALKTCASKFLEIYSTKPYELVTIAPEIIQSVELIEGEWGVAGFKILKHYTIDERAQVAKEVVEDINETNVSITSKVIWGDILEVYNSFRFITKLTPQVSGESVVHWTLEYEKPNEYTPDPYSILQAILQESRDVDACFGSHNCN